VRESAAFVNHCRRQSIFAFGLCMSDFQMTLNFRSRHHLKGLNGWIHRGTEVSSPCWRLRVSIRTTGATSKSAGTTSPRRGNVSSSACTSALSPQNLSWERLHLRRSVRSAIIRSWRLSNARLKPQSGCFRQRPVNGLKQSVPDHFEIRDGKQFS
jgi:hypothetical protein